MRVAVIPARGGSKRIPLKNIKPFRGMPIISYPIAVALGSGLFEHVIVSTDHDEIARVAEDHGAEVPFRRPPELSDDQTSTDDVLVHAFEECTRRFGDVREGCCIYPTNPFLDTDDLRRGLDLLTTHGATSSFPVVAYDFPIEQAFTLEGAHPKPRWPDLMMARSQDLAPHYHDAAMFYWCNLGRFLATRQLFAGNSVAFVVSSERCQDINTPEDWTRAEQKHKLLSLGVPE